MRDRIYCYVNKIKADKLRRRQILSVLLVMSVAVACCVSWMMRGIGTAMTDEVTCGLEEHIHTDACYESVLVCTNTDAEHIHTDECYERVLVCDIAEHTHDSLCYSDISADIETAELWQQTLPESLGDSLQDNVASIAMSQLGYAESVRNYVLGDDGATHMGYTRYGEWYGNPYGEWNAMFVYFCMYYAGVDGNVIPYGSGCYAWTQTLEQYELLAEFDVQSVCAGDIVFFDTDDDTQADRVGVVVSAEQNESESGYVLTVIEGDVNGIVAQVEYDLDTQMPIGYLSLDLQESSNQPIQLANVVQTNSNRLQALMTYSAVAYAAEGAEDNGKLVYVNGVQNPTTNENPLTVDTGNTVQIEVTLYRDKATYPKNYFVEVTEAEYNAKAVNNVTYFTCKVGDEIHYCYAPVSTFMYYVVDGETKYLVPDGWTLSNPIYTCTGEKPPCNRRYRYNNVLRSRRSSYGSSRRSSHHKEENEQQG